MRNLCEQYPGVICQELLAWEVLKLKIILLFFHKVLSVATFCMVLKDLLKGPIAEIEVGDDRVVVPFALLFDRIGSKEITL